MALNQTTGIESSLLPDANTHWPTRATPFATVLWLARSFDTASLQQGYVRAIDFVMGGVIESFANINRPLGRILAR